ncbi:hypothetical protein [Paragemmobacter aquarius]|uniref:hypothetical protein n=1 Tax=Paragemmobacter aquarius TaxID=2169400 RepID=UPI0038B27832
MTEASICAIGSGFATQPAKYSFHTRSGWHEQFRYPRRQDSQIGHPFGHRRIAHELRRRYRLKPRQVGLRHHRHQRQSDEGHGARRGAPLG